MKPQNKSKKAWIVVEVMAGIPALVKAFRYYKSARKHEKLLRRHMHPENDETGIFEAKI